MLVSLRAVAQQPDDSDRTPAEVDYLLEQAAQASGDSVARTLALKALAIAQEVHYNGGVARASMRLGELASRAGDSDNALQYYLEAEEKVLDAGNASAIIATKRALGDLFFQEKLYGHARRYYREILKYAPDDFMVREKAGDASLAVNQLDSAKFFYNPLIEKYKAEENFPRLVQIYQKLANASEQQKIGKGLFYYLAIADIIERTGTPPEKAVLYNNLGRQYVVLNDYPQALEYFRKAELQCDYITCDHPEVLYANLGIALHNTGKTKEGLNYLRRAGFLLADQKDYAELANLEHLTATVYFKSGDVYNAIRHNDEAIKYAKQTKQDDVLAHAYETAAELYHQLYDFEKAFDYYKKFLELYNAVHLEADAREQRLRQQRSRLVAAEGDIKYLLAGQRIKEIALQNAQNERERLQLLNANLELDARRKENEVLLLQKQKEVDQSRLREQTLLALRAKQDLRLAAQQLDAEKQNRLITELRGQEEKRFADSLTRAREVDLLRRDRDIADLKIHQQSNVQKFLIAAGLGLFLILALVGIALFIARRSRNRLALQNRQIQAQNAQIEAERRTSDRLLLNILPEEVAQELRTRGYASPRYYESATVLFTDFLNFTSLSAVMSPEELIAELEECFLAFDEISERNGLEKIKTIGDAYMCAGGLPIPNETHAEDAVRAALEMADWLKRRNKDNPKAVFREMRIGVHTGPVIAGVIGKNKFAYDIWGDAVNLAARLEELGAPGRVNVSRATAEAVKGRYRAHHRGKKEVHNKGQVDMYFIEREQ